MEPQTLDYVSEGAGETASLLLIRPTSVYTTYLCYATKHMQLHSSKIYHSVYYKGKNMYLLGIKSTFSLLPQYARALELILVTNLLIWHNIPIKCKCCLYYNIQNNLLYAILL